MGIKKIKNQSLIEQYWDVSQGNCTCDFCSISEPIEGEDGVTLERVTYFDKKTGTFKLAFRSNN